MNVRTNMLGGRWNIRRIRPLLLVLLAAAIALTVGGRALAQETPTQISTCQELQDMQDDLAGSYELANDIDCAELSNFAPIGNFAEQFTGSLAGQGFAIRGLSIDRQTNVGLIGVVGPGGSVTDLGLTGVNIAGGSTVGGLVGINEGDVTGSYVTGDVSGEINVGGLIGLNAGTVSASYVTGDVSGLFTVGGLIGVNRGSVSESYTSGAVSGSFSVGGLIGRSSQGFVTNSYWDQETAGQPASAAGTALTTAQMTGDNAPLSNMFGFDFVDTWQLTDSYPTLLVFATPAGTQLGGFDIGALIDWNLQVTASVLEPGELTETLVQPQAVAGGLGNVLVRFIVTNPLPGDGQIVVTLPEGFSLTGGADGTGVQSVNKLTLEGNQEVEVDISAEASVDSGTRTVTLQLASADRVDSGTRVSLVLTNVTHPPVSGVPDGSFVIKTSTIVTKTNPDETTTNERRPIDQALEVEAEGISPGTLIDPAIEPLNSAAGGVGDVKFTFTTANPLHANGQVVVTLPEGFVLSEDTGVLSEGLGVNATLTVDVETRTVTIQLSLDNSVDGETKVELTLTKVKNPTVTGVPPGFGAIETLTSNGTAIDQHQEVLAAEITAGELTPTNVQPQNLTAGAVGSVDVTFTLGNTLPSNGLIAVTFPEGFVLNSGPETSPETVVEGSTINFDGQSETGAIVWVLDQTVFIFRTGDGSDMVGGTEVELTLTNIKNPPVSGDTGLYEIRTNVLKEEGS